MVEGDGSCEGVEVLEDAANADSGPAVVFGGLIFCFEKACSFEVRGARRRREEARKKLSLFLSFALPPHTHKKKTSN